MQRSAVFVVLALGAGLALGLWLLGGERRDAAGAEPGPGTVVARVRDPGALLTAPDVLAPLPAPAAREPVLGRSPRARLRGRLVQAQGGAPLCTENIVLLSSEHDEVAETLRSDAEGRFASARAFPRGTTRAFVLEPETRARLARHEAAFDPASSDEWLVPVPAVVPGSTLEQPEPEAPEGNLQTYLSGEVVDLAAVPVQGAVVKLLPLGTPGEVQVSVTDGTGEFDLRELEPGSYRLLAFGRFTRSEPLELELVSGENEAGRILLPSRPVAGALAGELVAEAGGEDPVALLVLRDLASGKELAAAAEWKLFDGEDDGLTSFRLEGVPHGKYELSVIAADGRTYEPPSLRVEPPAEGLVFRTRDAVRPGHFLRVQDASTHDELERRVLLARWHGQWWGDEVGAGQDSWLPNGPDRWLVLAEGYRPRLGELPRAASRAEDTLPIEVDLARGYGRAFLFKDSESDRLVVEEAEGVFGPGLAGVGVLADGRKEATSDADGLALLDLPHAPARIEFLHPGWRVVAEREESGVTLLHMARE